MLHIVHVLHSMGIGGTENGVENVIRGLDGEFRHTVVSMTARGPLAERLPAAVAVHSITRRPGIDVAAMLRLRRLLLTLSPDILHSRNWGALDAVPAARLARVPVVIHGEHGREAHDPEGLDRRRNALRRALSPLVTRFVTVSHDLGRWLVDRVGIRAGKVVTIPNGVDLARFAEGDRQPGRLTLGIDADAMVIGSVGRLNPVKNQKALIEALARLDSAGVPAHLVIVGDGPCRDELAALARRPEVAGRVHLMGARQDVPSLLRAFDVFVLPSIAEGISNTILEAMATGLPVIATRTGGNPELVVDGVTGTLVPVGDVGALERALRVYAADPHLRSLHGKAGRQRSEQEFGLQRMVQRYGALYRSLAKRRSG